MSKKKTVAQSKKIKVPPTEVKGRAIVFSKKAKTVSGAKKIQTSKRRAPRKSK